MPSAHQLLCIPNAFLALHVKSQNSQRKALSCCLNTFECGQAHLHPVIATGHANVAWIWDVSSEIRNKTYGVFSVKQGLNHPNK